jgi:hypothetical protein
MLALTKIKDGVNIFLTKNVSANKKVITTKGGIK